MARNARKVDGWLDRIVQAFERLGGDAAYPALYAELAKGKRALTRNEQAGVRREIENHSSHSKNYKASRLDLFVSVGGIGSGHWGLRASSSASDEVQDGAEAFIATEEGRAKLRLHLTRERSRTLIIKFKAGLRSLACEVCGFDFEQKYGARGIGYVEAHHTVPIASLESGSKTKLSDLAAVCANCHRMLHRDGLASVTDIRASLRR